jgi:hypothetical protein
MRHLLKTGEEMMKREMEARHDINACNPSIQKAEVRGPWS